MEFLGTKNLPTKSIVPLETNNRTVKTPADDEALKTSMQTHGLYQPIIIRVIDTGEPVCVAGRRRLSSALALKWVDIRCELWKMNDAEAAVITNQENTLRLAKAPLDQAADIEALFSVANMSNELAAQLLGIDVGSVARRRQVLKLSPSWKKELKRNHRLASLLSIDHLAILARLTQDKQELINKEMDAGRVHVPIGPSGVSLSEWRRVLTEGMNPLAGATWELDDATLDPKAGSCSECPKRIQQHSVLFDDMQIGKSGTCQDQTCFENKARLHSLRIIDKAKETNKPVVVLTCDPKSSKESVLDEGEIRAIGAAPMTGWELSDSFRKSKEKDKNSIAVLTTDGKIEYFKPKTGGQKVTAVTLKQEKKPLTLKEKAEKLLARRQAALIVCAQDLLYAAGRGKKKDTAQFTKTVAGNYVRMLALAIDFGSRYCHDTPASFQSKDRDWIAYDSIDEGKPKVNIDEWCQEFRISLASIMARRISCDKLEFAANCMVELERVCQVFELPLKEWAKKIESEIPIPKSVANDDKFLKLFAEANKKGWVF